MGRNSQAGKQEIRFILKTASAITFGLALWGCNQHRLSGFGQTLIDCLKDKTLA